MARIGLYLVCRKCGTEFDTRLRLERRSFERGTLAANYHACPACGARQAYRKSDYVVREEQPLTKEGPPPTAGTTGSAGPD